MRKNENLKSLIISNVPLVIPVGFLFHLFIKQVCPPKSRCFHINNRCNKPVIHLTWDQVQVLCLGMKGISICRSRGAPRGSPNTQNNPDLLQQITEFCWCEVRKERRGRRGDEERGEQHFYLNQHEASGRPWTFCFHTFISQAELTSFPPCSGQADLHLPLPHHLPHPLLNTRLFVIVLFFFYTHSIYLIGHDPSSLLALYRTDMGAPADGWVGRRGQGGRMSSEPEVQRCVWWVVSERRHYHFRCFPVEAQNSLT